MGARQSTPQSQVRQSTAQAKVFGTCVSRRQRQKTMGGCTVSPQQPWRQPQWTQKDTAAAIRCLSNRSVWVLGNSVARHWAFALAAILDGVRHPKQMSSTSREMEKERCGRGGAWGGQRPNSSAPQACQGACACDFDVRSRLGPHAALLFKWNFALDDTMLGIGFADLMTSGIPESLLRESGGELSPGISPPDILIYNAFQQSQRAPALAAQVTRALKARPGFHFYWRATTAMCDSDKAVRADHNEGICKLNERIERYLCHGRRRVRLLDGFGWTIHRCDGYDDRMHHSRLAFDHVTAFLRQECRM